MGDEPVRPAVPPPSPLTRSRILASKRKTGVDKLLTDKQGQTLISPSEKSRSGVADIDKGYWIGPVRKL